MAKLLLSIWKDFTCEFKRGKDLAEKGREYAKQYKGEELEKRCHISEVYSSASSYHCMEDESKFGWIESTLKYRLWRLNVRWDRIGRRCYSNIH